MLANSLIEVHDTDISRTRNKNIAGENGNRSHPGTYRLFLMINMENLLEERKRRNRCQHTHGIGQGVANWGILWAASRLPCAFTAAESDKMGRALETAASAGVFVNAPVNIPAEIMGSILNNATMPTVTAALTQTRPTVRRLSPKPSVRRARKKDEPDARPMV